MIALLGTIGGLFGLDPLGKAAKFAGGTLVAVLLIAAVWGGWAIIKSNIIADHETSVGLQTEKADRKADANAAQQRREDEARTAQEAGELKEAEANAQTDLDRRLARHRCLRMQQDARAKGEPPPNC